MILKVSAAIITYSDRYLAARRALGKSSGGKWEFPGGKVESGETPEAALIREIQEELALEIAIRNKIGIFTTDVAGTLIELHCFHATPCSIAECPELVLNDHSEVKWCLLAELAKLDWADADIPVVEHLRQHPVDQ